MKIVFECDPNTADLGLAPIVKTQQLRHGVEDFGAEDPVYVNAAMTVAKVVAAGEFDRGVLICGTGIGASTVANKVKGTYCARVMDIHQVQHATLNNNTNLIATGSQVVGVKLAKTFLEEYLKYTFDPVSCSEAKVARTCEFERED